MTRWLLAAYVLSVLAAAGVGAYLGRAHKSELDAERQARKAAEAERLEAAGLVVVAEREREDLETSLAELLKRDAVLEDELARAPRAAKLRVVATVEASTAPAPAVGEPRPAETGEGLCSSCLVAPGDRLQIRVGEVVARTEAGNRVVLGSASLWRLSPPPESRLLAAPFSAPLTEVAVVVEPAPVDYQWPSRRDLVNLGLGVLAGGAAVYAVRR